MGMTDMADVPTKEHPLEEVHHKEGERSAASGYEIYLIGLLVAALVIVAVAYFFANNF